MLPELLLTAPKERSPVFLEPSDPLLAELGLHQLWRREEENVIVQGCGCLWQYHGGE